MKKQLSEKKLAPIFRRGDCCCCTFAPSFKSDQCDQIGRFLKVFCQKFLIKVSKIFYCFEGHLQKCPFSSKACCGNFWTTFGNFGLLFIPISGHTESDRRIDQKISFSSCTFRKVKKCRQQTS